MKKKGLILVLAIAGLAVAGYVAYRWWQARQAGTPVGGLGTNLNSIAPELIGGSSGPSVGPALSTPITITLIDSGPGQMEGPSGLDKDDFSNTDVERIGGQFQGPPGRIGGHFGTPPGMMQGWSGDMTPVGNTTPTALDLANPTDSQFAVGVVQPDMSEEVNG